MLPAPAGPVAWTARRYRSGGPGGHYQTRANSLVDRLVGAGRQSPWVAARGLPGRTDRGQRNGGVRAGSRQRPRPDGLGLGHDRRGGSLQPHRLRAVFPRGVATHEPGRRGGLRPVAVSRSRMAGSTGRVSASRRAQTAVLARLVARPRWLIPCWLPERLTAWVPTGGNERDRRRRRGVRSIALQHDDSLPGPFEGPEGASGSFAYDRSHQHTR